MLHVVALPSYINGIGSASGGFAGCSGVVTSIGESEESDMGTGGRTDEFWRSAERTAKTDWNIDVMEAGPVPAGTGAGVVLALGNMVDPKAGTAGRGRVGGGLFCVRVCSRAKSEERGSPGGGGGGLGCELGG